MSSTSAPVTKPPYWQRQYDPVKVVAKIEKTVNELKQARIHNITWPIFNTLKVIGVTCGIFGVFIGGLILSSQLGVLAPLAYAVSLAVFAAGIFASMKWIRTLPTPPSVRVLESKLDKRFNKLFIADQGKLTPEHIQFLQTHAIQIQKPSTDRFLGHEFGVGIETAQAIKTLAAISEITKDTVLDSLKGLNPDALLSMDTIADLKKYIITHITTHQKMRETISLIVSLFWIG